MTYLAHAQVLMQMLRQAASASCAALQPGLKARVARLLNEVTKRHQRGEYGRLGHLHCGMPAAHVAVQVSSRSLAVRLSSDEMQQTLSVFHRTWRCSCWPTADCRGAHLPWPLTYQAARGQGLPPTGTPAQHARKSYSGCAARQLQMQLLLCRRKYDWTPEHSGLARHCTGMLCCSEEHAAWTPGETDTDGIAA